MTSAWQTGDRRRSLLVAAAAACATAPPFVAFTRLVLYHFYERGSFLLDTGLLAFLMWHGDAALHQPASLGGASFFATHVTPLFVPLSALSRLLPLSLPQFFAAFVGLSHALLALAVFWLLAAGYRLRGASIWLAALAGIGFAFSGLALAIARYPHFETLIPACFLLFVTARILGHPRLGVLFLALGLAVREDAGLHYAAVLLVAVALGRAPRMSLRDQRGDLGFALAALLYAVATLAAQHVLFPDGSAFERVYLGTPPLAHVTVGLIGRRLLYFLINRPYVLLPACGAAIWALRTRDPAPLVGYVAALPWLLLHLLAKAPLAGAMASYYAFPFLIALAWPLVVAVRRYREGRGGGPAGPLIGFALLLALSFIPAADLHDPGRLPLPSAFLASPSLARQNATDRAVAALSAARPALGRLLVDNSVAAIDPAGFDADEVPFRGGVPPASIVTPDTIALFAEGYDAARLRDIAAAAGLSHRYVVAGTSLRVLTRDKPPDIPPLAPLLVQQ